MSQSPRKIKTGFWVILSIVGFFSFVFIADWWKTNSTIGLIILLIILAGVAFALYRFPGFRNFFFRTAKETAIKVAFEKEAPKREPVPVDIRKIVTNRSASRCENPDCEASARPHLHHIDNDFKHNSPKNIIALCPNCHSNAHQNKMTNSQLRNWVQRSYESYKSLKQVGERLR
ncbi:MAG: HNH endonuclease [Chloroflexi bacterium]|nr:HNH endonuclease [Chloroflexota bacterium]